MYPYQACQVTNDIHFRHPLSCIIICLGTGVFVCQSGVNTLKIVHSALANALSLIHFL